MESTNLVQEHLSAQTTPPDLLLLIFIHGFKGTDSTFGEFPQRLQHILTETLSNTNVESIIFPAYETKGELNAAVVRFADWLTDLTVRREVANGGAGRAKIVLCGHSMGGFLAADALVEFVRTRPDRKAPLWPNIVGCIAYDTPYLGVHPHVFKNSATQAADYVKQATNVLNSFKTWRAKAASSAAAASAAPVAVDAPPVPPKSPTAAPQEPSAGMSLWQKWAMPAAITVGGALFAGAAGAAYYKRDDIGAGYTWVTEHLKYVGSLWNQAELEGRLDTLFQIESGMDVLFNTFFTYLPPNSPNFPTSRTFAVLPHSNTHAATHFVPNRNSLAVDEIQAHTGMFDGKTNDGYYDLGLQTAQLIQEAVHRHCAIEAAAQQAPVSPKQAEEVKEAMHASATAQAAEAAARSAPAGPATVEAAAAAAAVVAVPVVAAAVEEESGEEDDEEEEGGEETKSEVKKETKAAEEESSGEEDEDDEEEEVEDEDDDEEEEEEEEGDDEEEEEEEDEEEDEEDEEEEEEEEEEEDEEETKSSPSKKA